jgi:site-specific recombinase XerD
VSRETYAMLLVNNGITIESVSSMLGYSKIQVTKTHYAKIKLDTITKEFKEFAAKKGISLDKTLNRKPYGIL